MQALWKEGVTAKNVTNGNPDPVGAEITKRDYQKKWPPGVRQAVTLIAYLCPFLCFVFFVSYAFYAVTLIPSVTHSLATAAAPRPHSPPSVRSAHEGCLPPVARSRAD